MRMRMVGDDGTRADLGTLVSVKRAPSGLRIVVDRVTRTAKGDWTPRAPVTFKDFSEEEILAMTMSPNDLQALGTLIVAELNAALSRSWPKG